MMFVRDLHPWDLTPKEAVQLQLELQSRLRLEGSLPKLRFVAGTDVSYSRSLNVAVAVVVMLTFPDLEVVEVGQAIGTPTFPYVPGLLAFREIPLLLEAFRRIRMEPDAVIVDGHGTAHPRRFGLACHLGLLLDRPTLGCAKSVLVGTFTEPLDEPGTWSYLTDQGLRIGAVLRTRRGVRPVFVSPGHRLDIPGAVEIAWRCCRGYRLPEPVRAAHATSLKFLPST